MACFIPEHVEEPAGDRARPASTRVVAVFPEPTPYRAPLLDRVAAPGRPVRGLRGPHRRRADPDVTKAPRRLLRGVRVPGVVRLLRHDYPITPGV